MSSRRPGGGYALTYPRRLGFGLKNTVVSLAWRTGDDIVVSRTDPQHPVSYVNLDGVNSDGPSRNLLMPVGGVAANPSTVYVADARGILQLSGSAAENDPRWVEVRPLMTPGRDTCSAGLNADAFLVVQTKRARCPLLVAGPARREDSPCPSMICRFPDNT